jgi:hypothetical protein
MLGRLAGNAVESLVGDGDPSFAESAKEVLNLGGALPDEDRLGLVRRAERVDQSDQRRVARFTPDQPVVAQGAAGAQSSAMVSGFHVAAFTMEVVGDRSARRADRLPIGVGRTRQQPFLKAWMALK